MKLVVCYSHGSEGSGFWQEHVCVEYESKEHFLVAFIDAFDAWAVARNGSRELERRLAAARSSQDNKKIEKALAELLSFNADNHTNRGLVVDGWSFDYFQDYEQDRHGVMTIIAMPEVHTLDEWFELNRPEWVGK